MNATIIRAWLADQHQEVHNCSDPFRCEDKIVYPPSPPKRPRSKDPTSSGPRTKRRRALADIDCNTGRGIDMDAHSQRRRCPRKISGRKIHKDSQGPVASGSGGSADPFVDEEEDQGTEMQTTPKAQRAKGDPALQAVPLRQPVTFFSSALSMIGGTKTPVLSDASSSRGGKSSVSGHSRSSSPVKNPHDLLKLEKPVLWTSPNPRDLKNSIKDTGSKAALGLFDRIWAVLQGRGYLPKELKDMKTSSWRMNFLSPQRTGRWQSAPQLRGKQSLQTD